MGNLIPEPPQYPETQAFGANANNGVNPPGGHTGWDKGTPVGVELRAPSDGVVMFEGFPQTDNGSDNPWLLVRGGGLCCVIDSLDGQWTWTLGHLSQTLVSKGDKVRKGQVIAVSGATGFVTGPHHHFGVLPDKWNVRNGTYGYINPAIACKEWYGERPALNPNERWNGDHVTNQRRTAELIGMPGEAGNNVVREIPPGNREVFEGFVHGQELTIEGFTSDIWYQDKIGFAWCGSFENPTTDGLADLTPRRVLKANERLVIASGAVARRDPVVTPDNVVRFIEGNTVEVFTGFVHGENVNGNDVWFVDAKGFAWSGNFEDHGVVGLPDLTVVVPPAPLVPAPVVDFAHLNGIDVSMYQERAALNLLNADFVWIKATEGGGNWDDDALASNVAEARLAGKAVGFYHFARPMLSAGNTAAEEARSFLAVIAPFLQLGDVVILDWEAENQHRTDWALEWLDIVAKATGAVPLIYMNAKAIKGTEEHPDPDWSAVEAKYPLWFAGGSRFGKQITGHDPQPVDGTRVSWKSGVVAWQYTAKGRLAGYDGDLDLNTFYGTLAQLKELGATKLLQEEKPNDPIFEPPAGLSEADVKIVLDAYNAWLRDRFTQEQNGK